VAAGAKAVNIIPVSSSNGIKIVVLYLRGKDIIIVTTDIFHV